MGNRFCVESQEDMPPPCWQDLVEPFLQKLSQHLGYDKEDISVMFCTDSYIKNLNATYRKIDSATDILSFVYNTEYEEAGTLWRSMGDIAISVETLAKNAEIFNVSMNEELKRLLIHGLLHLNGMDHGDEHISIGETPNSAMLILQEKLLHEFEDYKIIQ